MTIKIAGTGSAFPETVMTNDDLAKVMNTSDEWISSRTGIKERRIVKEETAKDEVSVIITKAPCVLLKKQKSTVTCRPVSDKCKKCGACLRPGCPAITKNADGTISIDETMCNGCGLCKGLCKFDAIEQVEV